MIEIGSSEEEVKGRFTLGEEKAKWVVRHDEERQEIRITIEYKLASPG